MNETVSPSDENLILLDGEPAFVKHALQMVQRSRRRVCILSRELDFPLYDNSDLADALSAMVRDDRNASVQILVKDTRPLIERGHALLHLARRLPSKISIRRLTIPPANETMAFMLGDNDLLLYQHDEGQYQGFANYHALLECRDLLAQFTYLWEQHGVTDPALRDLRGL